MPPCSALSDYEVRCRVEKMIQKHLKWTRFSYEKLLYVSDVGAQKFLTQRQLTQLKEMGAKSDVQSEFFKTSVVDKTHCDSFGC